MPMTLQRTETKVVPISVRKINLATGQTVDVTQASLAEAGFVLAADGGTSPPTLWHAATWIANPTLQLYWLGPLVGPGGVIQLAVGEYVPYVHILLSGEEIIQASGDTLTIID